MENERLDVDKLLSDLGISLKAPSPIKPQQQKINPADEYLRILDSVNRQAAEIFNQQMAMIERFNSLLRKK